MAGLNPGSYNLTNGIRIGANYADNNDWFKGDMAEFIVLDETSDSTTISKMEGYLAHKWGLADSLPTSHTYKSAPHQTVFHYVSSNPDILEINGTSAIVRGGGTVTVTANAPENSGAFAANPVVKSISIAKAPLIITGQDLSLSVGDSILTT